VQVHFIVTTANVRSFSTGCEAIVLLLLGVESGD
jgi:hypothetical protein